MGVAKIKWNLYFVESKYPSNSDSIIAHVCGENKIKGLICNTVFCNNLLI